MLESVHVQVPLDKKQYILLFIGHLLISSLYIIYGYLWVVFHKIMQQEVGKSRPQPAADWMKITVATPLYPPDIGGAASYIKELARRLSEKHTVTVVTYGCLPEKVPGVAFISIDKRQMLPLRLLRYTSALLRTLRKTDLLYAENGPSVELPLYLAGHISKKPFVMHIGDMATHKYAAKRVFRRMIERAAFRRALCVVEENPLWRPEILPFESFPKQAFDAYEGSWEKHIAHLEEIFTHAGK
jgi:glycosyltransferase involved in cell wall biosynthesis